MDYKPKRLRTILLGYGLKTEDIDRLEQEIKTFVKHTIYSTKELGLKVECEDWIGDFD